MWTFLKDNQSEFFYSAVIIAITFALLILTHIFHKWLNRKKQENYSKASTFSLNIGKRILNTLWTVLGIMGVSFQFVSEQNYDGLIADFRLFLYLAILSVVTLVAASTTNFWFRKKIALKIAQKDDPTTLKFLRYVVIVLICFTGLLFALLAFPSLKGVAQTALGGAGVIAIVIGIASQEALSNLIGGFFIISFKPFKIGDIIRISDNMFGTVTDITLRHTVIKDYENKMIVIPNSVINKEKLVNYDLGDTACCERIEIGISYDSNVKLARKIIQEECENHPLILDKRTFEEKEKGLPIVRTALTQLNDSSVTIRGWAWARNYQDSFDLRCAVYESVKERFTAEHIEIPFPHRTIVNKV